MSGEDGRYQLVYNGEIYNFRELRAELKREGRHFHTSSDTEVLLQAYVTWGAYYRGSEFTDPATTPHRGQGYRTADRETVRYASSRDHSRRGGQ